LFEALNQPSGNRTKERGFFFTALIKKGAGPLPDEDKWGEAEVGQQKGKDRMGKERQGKPRRSSLSRRVYTPKI